MVLGFPLGSVLALLLVSVNTLVSLDVVCECEEFLGIKLERVMSMAVILRTVAPFTYPSSAVPGTFMVVISWEMLSDVEFWVVFSLVK